MRSTIVYVVYDAAHEEVVSVHWTESGACARVLDKQHEGVHPDALDIQYYPYKLEE